MKQKSLPEDFQVEELTDFAADGGRYALYRLRKRGLGTPEAIEAVVRRWRLDRRQVSFGGLKDRHAATVQWVTIERGPQRDLRQERFEMLYRGQASRPFDSKDIAGNRFCITVRDLSQADAAQAEEAAPAVVRDGLPNYFDQQRFGSVGQSGEFIARAWCEGDHERGLWLVLADANPHDRPADHDDRKLLRSRWGKWDELRGTLRTSPGREIAAHLAIHPGDFRRATELIRPDLRSIYMAAFQSFLWNRALAELLREKCVAGQLFDVPLGRWTVPLFRELDPPVRDALAGLNLPLPAARMEIPAGPVRTLFDRVLSELGLELGRLKIKYPRRTFFSKGERPALFFPQSLRHEARDDEVYPKRKKLVLRFDLPRGAYATMLLRRITAGMARDEGAAEGE